MAASLFIFFHDDTWDEIKLGDGNELYWKPTMQGLMIRQEGVRGCRTVYPWQSIRKYHVETEAGLRDQKRRERKRSTEQLGRKFKLDPEAVRHFQGGGPVGGCGDVHVKADPSGGGAEGNAAERSQ